MTVKKSLATDFTLAKFPRGDNVIYPLHVAAEENKKTKRKNSMSGKNKKGGTGNANLSNFAQESAAAGAASGTSAPSSAMLALFQPRANLPTIAGVEMKRMNMPQMVKPDAIPVGGVVAGILKSAVKSPVSTIKGCLLWLALVRFSDDGKEISDAGKEITFPCTGVIRNALIPGVDGEKDVLSSLEKLQGRLIVMTRTDDRVSSKYKKAMYMFDVHCSEKTVDVEPAKP